MPFTQITTSNLDNTISTKLAAAEAANAAVANIVSLAISSVQIADGSYNVLDDTAANTGGGYLVINGTGFTNQCVVIVGTTNATSTTFANTKQLRAQVPALSAATYPVYVTDTVTGATATKINGLTFSSFPVWGTATALANVLSNTVFSTTLSANSDSSVTYSNTTILPTGTTLLSNGYFYGNISVGSATTYSFDVKASDAELQDQTKTFSLSAITAAPYSINYLMVAGGGGGGGTQGPGSGGGGGGAGGLLSGSTTFLAGTPYTITVGAGGNGGASTPGTSGTSSFISDGVTAIAVAVGGGYGATQTPGAGPGALGYGANGGSGGGGAGTPGNGYSPNAGGVGGYATGSPGVHGIAGPQGYPGSSAVPGPGTNPVAGGGAGGGAGGAATNAVGIDFNTTPAGSGPGGTGGVGAIWPFTGPSVYYAGGGGGGKFYFGGGNGSGGNGGGAPGGNAIAGTTNRGGGGGGGGYPNSGGAGGSGVVIIAIPTPSYPGSAPPAASVTTPPAAPGKTVLTYTSSGTFIA